jgi:hypothetical protein
MIPVIRLDPGSLSLWYDPQLIYQVHYGEQLAVATHHAMFGNRESLLEHLYSIVDETIRVKCIHLASSVWHEQRHFLDLILTNYGAMRIRQFLLLYVNSSLLLNDAQQADGKLACPLDLYDDPFRRNVMGVSALERCMAVGRESFNRKEWLRDDRQLLPTFAGRMECGGEAQLEALAYYTQYSAVQDLFGNDTSLKVQHEVTKDNPKGLKYRWAQIVANMFGLVPTRAEGANVGTVDISFLVPIIYGSLMSRAWGQQQVTNQSGSTHRPLTRLAGFLTALQGKFKSIGGISLEDAWEIVNATAKQMWGRTIIEELDEDYKREGAWIDDLQKLEYVADSVKNVSADFHRLRGKLIRLLKEAPAVIFNPRLTGASGLFLPMPVLVNTAGDLGELPDGWEQVFGYTYSEQPDVKWFWAVIPEQWPPADVKAFTLQDRVSWARVISHHTPLAKLMMNGRKHRTILGPELLFVETDLKAQLNLDLAIDPLFKYPPEVDDINAYYTLADKTEAVCDMCKAELKKPHGHYVSGWVFRSSEKNKQLAIDTYGGGPMGELVFLKDWSPWILCDKDYHKVMAD